MLLVVGNKEEHSDVLKTSLISPISPEIAHQLLAFEVVSSIWFRLNGLIFSKVESGMPSASDSHSISRSFTIGSWPGGHIPPAVFPTDLTHAPNR
jgi:hypothetical protein